MCNRNSTQLSDSPTEPTLLTVRVAFPCMWPIAQNKSDATYTLKTPSRTQLPMQTCHNTGGSMSRTDNFRNASCLEVKESTTKRAKSQIKRSSLRQWITKVAKSVTVALRLNFVESNCLKETGWGLDRSASRKRFLCAEHVGQSKSAFHSVSRCIKYFFIPDLTKQAKTLQLNVTPLAGKLLPPWLVRITSREVCHTAQKM